LGTCGGGWFHRHDRWHLNPMPIAVLFVLSAASLVAAAVAIAYGLARR
jgi:hypothetical protein